MSRSTSLCTAASKGQHFRPNLNQLTSIQINEPAVGAHSLRLYNSGMYRQNLVLIGTLTVMVSLVSSFLFGLRFTDRLLRFALYGKIEQVTGDAIAHSRRPHFVS